MSELEAAGVVEPTADQAPIEGQEQTEQVATEDQEPEAVVTPTGEKLVPLSALLDARNKVKELKPLAGKVSEMETELAELRNLRPYAEFVKANPHLLQPQQPAQPPPSNQPDPELEQYARRFDLYTPEGKPDVDRARAIREDNAKIAREEAQKVIQPYETRTLAQQAAANLQWLGGQKDAYGRQLTEDALREAVAPLIQGMDEANRVRAMADPQVAQLILRQAKAIQLEKMPNAPVQPPQNPPLVTESAGGPQRITLSEADKRIGARAGLTEQQIRDRFAKFNPNSANRLE